MPRPTRSGPGRSWTATVPKAGQYRLLARYEYPAREYHVQVRRERGAGRPAAGSGGAGGAGRDADLVLQPGRRAWHELPHGVPRGWWSRAAALELVAGPARFTLEVLGGPEPAAEPDARPAAADERPGRVVQDARDASVPDAGRDRGGGGGPAVRAGRPTRATAARASTWRGGTRSTGCRGRSPRSSSTRPGCRGSSGRPVRLEPGERTPWVDVSCRDTTHSAHLQLTQVNNSQNRRVTLLVDLASAPERRRDPADDRVSRGGRRAGCW